MLHSHTLVSYQLRECSYPKVYLRKILPLGHFLSSVPYIFMKLATWMFLELQVSSSLWATLVLNVFTCGVSLLWILKRGWGYLGCFLSLLLGSSTCPRTICWGRASVSQQSGLRFFYCLWVTKDMSPAFFNLFLLWLLIILCNHSYYLWVAWAYKEIQWYMVKLIRLLVETFSYTSAGVLPTAIMLELWYAVYEMNVRLLPEQSIKQLLVDRHQPEKFNTYCTESSENKKRWTEDERCLILENGKHLTCCVCCILLARLSHCSGPHDALTKDQIYAWN